MTISVDAIDSPAKRPEFPRTLQPTENTSETMTALVTNASKLRFDSCHITRDVIDAIVGTPLGDRIETLGEVDKGNEAKLEPEALLAAARGFPRLAELHIPKETKKILIFLLKMKIGLIWKLLVPVELPK